MSLAVLAPLSIEAWALRSTLRQAKVIRTGGGEKRARQAAQMLQDSPHDAIAVAGLCGALDANLQPGEVVVACEVCGNDRTQSLRLRGADNLVIALKERGISAHLGVIRSVDHVVRGAEREQLSACGAIAVDMESVWLAEAARDRPCAVLRVVLDSARHELIRPAIVANSFRALATLRRAAPALESWYQKQ